MSEQVQNALLRLFSCCSKAEVRALAKVALVTKKELADIIQAAAISRSLLRHMAYFREIIPEHLRLSDGESGCIGSLLSDPERGQKARSKIANLISARRQMAIHLFWIEQHGPWWIISVNPKELRPDSHWEGGSHVHMVSWLTHPTADPMAIMDRLTNDPKPKVGGSFHIRFEEQGRTEP